MVDLVMNRLVVTIIIRTAEEGALRKEEEIEKVGGFRGFV
jgi:hypothetical protein